MNRVVKSAALLSAISLLVRFLGPVKGYLIADRFGVSRTLDAYYLSQNVVDVTLAIVTFSITLLVVPLFTEEFARRGWGDEPFHRSIDAFLCQTALIALVICGALMAFSPQIAGRIPGFADAASRAELARILRVVSASLVFAIPFAVLAGYLYATARVVLPSLLNHLVLVATVASILFLAAPLGVLSIPVGGVLGTAIAFALIFAAFLRQRGRFRFGLRDTTVLKRVGGLLLPTMVFTAGGYVNLLTDQVVASSISAGAVSLLAYSQFILTLPYVLVTLPILTAIFPELARHKASDGGAAMDETLGHGLVLLILALLPLLIALLYFRVPLVELFFRHGKFAPGFVPQAADILLAYGLSTILLSCNSLIQRLFLVEGKMVPLMGLTLVSLVANLAMDLYFAARLSVAGIALATSLNEAWYFAAILWLLRKSLPGIFPRWARHLTGQGLAAGGIMLASLLVSTQLVALPGTDHKVALAAALIVHSGIAAIVYGVALLLFSRGRALSLLRSRAR